jgi:hypothetical protein
VRPRPIFATQMLLRRRFQHKCFIRDVFNNNNCCFLILPASKHMQNAHEGPSEWPCYSFFSKNFQLISTKIMKKDVQNVPIFCDVGPSNWLFSNKKSNLFFSNLSSCLGWDGLVNPQAVCCPRLLSASDLIHFEGRVFVSHNCYQRSIQKANSFKVLDSKHCKLFKMIKLFKY